MMSRRTFCKTASVGAAAASMAPSVSCWKKKPQRPNVILIITDDQGYGDFGVKGNPVLKTPNLDRLAGESLEMTNYYVSPVCAPTRACLMTGRYNYRTRVIDTFLGRAMMDPEETTLAELLQNAGYATALFGKWHLGDNYPMRPQERGFEQALMHRGGGIGQPSDPVNGENKYTDPVLWLNGREMQMTGYCTDIYFDQAMKWMAEAHHQGRPFFTYLAPNAPHSPYDDVPPEWYEVYRRLDLSHIQFPSIGHPLTHTVDSDRMARIYAMIANIDWNIGRLLSWLKETQLEQDTMVLFMNDNGPQGRRYVAGYKGMKTTIYEGGIRSPLFIRWPAELPPGRKIDRVVAHIDILPTILQACGIPVPHTLNVDGRSFWPLLKGESEWPDRCLVFQSHRGDRPVLYHNYAIRIQEWKLLHASDFSADSFAGAPSFELYDMKNDPFELHDVAGSRPDKVEELKKAYEDWFQDVSTTRPDNFEPPRIHVGTPHENPVTLTRQDWRHEQGPLWGERSNGHWRLYAAQPGLYTFHLRFHSEGQKGLAVLAIGDRKFQQGFSSEQTEIVFNAVQLASGELNLRGTLSMDRCEKGPWQIDVHYTR